MAKTKAQKVITFIPRVPKKRKGIISKTKASKMKQSKNYIKRYRGQGR